jgi:hypothetical protein
MLITVNVSNVHRASFASHMKFLFSILFFCVFFALTSEAQYLVRGTVQDSTGESLVGALVRVKFGNDSVGGVADVNGSFVLRGVKSSRFTLSTSYLGFQTFIKTYNFDVSQKEISIPVIQLKANATSLNAVVITGVPPVRVKEDTVEFNAKSFPVREGDAVEEVLKKLPGVEVDADGNVTTEGKPITRIRLNGKDFFGEDVAVAIKNLPADIVKNLQVIDDYGDQANLTGIKTGEPEKILNINIEEDKKRGYFGRATAGLGNSDRYIADVRANSFKGERQIAVNGILNNTNRRGGGGDGITDTKAASVSYRNEWGKELSANGNYRFAHRNNNTIGTALRQNFLQQFTRIENESNTSTSGSSSHNLGGNVEYRPDTLNFIKLSPYFSFNDSENINNGIATITQPGLRTLRDNASLSDAFSLNVGTNLFVNHKFPKKGRNISVYSFFNFSNGDNFRNAQNEYTITDSLGLDSLRFQNQLIDSDNQNMRIGANFSYTEPIGNRSYLELRYNRSVSSTKSNRETRDVENGTALLNQNQSNRFQYRFITNRIGLNYKFLKEKYHFTLGFSAQPALLEGENLTKGVTIAKPTLNWTPTARAVYRFSKQKLFTLNYNGRNNQPGFNQLQPLTDSSNLQNVVVGNPDLKPEFTHGLDLKYSQSDWTVGHTMFVDFSISQTEDKIVTTKIQIPQSVNQVTSYINTNGFYTIRSNYSYSKPFAGRKFTITWNGGAAFDNNVAFNDNSRIVAQNFLVSQALEFELDLENIIDLEFETSYSVNTTKYSQALQDRRTNRLEFEIEGRNYFFNDLTLGYDLTKVINRGFNNANVRNPTLLSVYTEYRFFKGNRGLLRFQAFDLLNQNTGIQRDVFDNIIVDRQTNRLGRYFLVTLGMRMNKFGGS